MRISRSRMMKTASWKELLSVNAPRKQIGQSFEHSSPTLRNSISWERMSKSRIGYRHSRRSNRLHLRRQYWCTPSPLCCTSAFQFVTNRRSGAQLLRSRLNFLRNFYNPITTDATKKMQHRIPLDVLPMYYGIQKTPDFTRTEQNSKNNVIARSWVLDNFF